MPMLSYLEFIYKTGQQIMYMVTSVSLLILSVCSSSTTVTVFCSIEKQAVHHKSSALKCNINLSPVQYHLYVKKVVTVVTSSGELHVCLVKINMSSLYNGLKESIVYLSSARINKATVSYFVSHYLSIWIERFFPR